MTEWRVRRFYASRYFPAFLLAMGCFYPLGAGRFAWGTEEVRIPRTIRVRALEDGSSDFVIGDIQFPDDFRVEDPPPFDEDTMRRELGDSSLTPEERSALRQRWDERRQAHHRMMMRAEESRELFDDIRHSVRRLVQMLPGEPREIPAFDLLPRPAEGEIVLRGRLSARDLRDVYGTLQQAWPKRLMPWRKLLLMEDRSPEYDPGRYRIVFETGWPEGEAVRSPALVDADLLPGCNYSLTFISRTRSRIADPYEVVEYRLMPWGRTFLFQRASPPRHFSRVDLPSAMWGPREPTPIRIAQGEQGTAELTGYAQHCMFSAKFAIVVRDAQGRIVWDAYDQANDSVALLVGDLSHNGRDELLIVEVDHERFTLRVFSDDANIGPRTPPPTE